MTATTDFERSIASWLERAGPDDVPARVVEAALAEARTVRQRPAWLTATWWTFAAGRAVRPTRIIDRLPTIPVLRPPLRLAWAVVVLAALLALLAGLLAVGAPRDDPLFAAACPGGSSPDRAGPADQARPDGEALSAVWNAGDGLSVVAFGTTGTWTFDVCSNTWRRLGGAEPWQASGALAVVFDADSDLVVGVGRDEIWSFDVEAGTWTAMGAGPGAPGAPRGFADPRAVYDPVTGLVVVLDRTSVWSYDVDRNTWRAISTAGPAGQDLAAPGYSLVAYDASADRIVLYKTGPAVNTGMRTWEFDIRTGTWARSISAKTPFVNLGFFASDEIAYDGANERTLVFGNGAVAAYDATADAWAFAYGKAWSAEPLGYGSLYRRPGAVAFDPLNRRLVVFGGEFRTEAGWVTTDDVLAFDVASGEWLELLAPGSIGAR